MLASEFIERLRNAGELYRPERVEPNEYRDRRLDEFFTAVAGVYPASDIAALDADRDAFFDGTRNPFQEIADGILRTLVQTIDDPELRERLSDPDRFAVAVDHPATTRGFNSVSFQLGDAWLALVDYRLIQTLYVCSRAVSGRVNLSAGQAACEVCGDPDCGTPSAAISARRWFEAGLRGRMGVARMPSEHWNPTGQQLAYANAIAVAAESFVMGDELGRFSYGGSTLAVVFQPGAIDHFTVSPPTPDEPEPPIQVNAQIAVAR